MPSYVALSKSGVLAARALEARAHLEACDLCPQQCGVNRLAGELGVCRAGAPLRVASANVHRWEEPPISGTRGSGTVFYSHCTARCLFCQNYPISQLGVGRDVDAREMADLMLGLQSRGCHNINLVTATHYVPQFLAALDLAARDGLCIPILYNTSGYDSIETLRLLEDVIDIYLPDSKYADNAVGRRLSGFDHYVQHNRAVLIEIHRQVGSHLVLDDEGIARRGMIVRHLVLPLNLSQTSEVLAWIAENLSRDVHVSLMAQYFPAHKAVDHPELGRGLTRQEYEAAIDVLARIGLENGWCQELEVQSY